ncbi:MAG: hypothetical protein JNK82_20035 [Myxococcaceae bacterium]|nr:hypothetical protein [Myxococcaceae bacterium]
MPTPATPRPPPPGASKPAPLWADAPPPAAVELGGAHADPKPVPQARDVFSTRPAARSLFAERAREAAKELAGARLPLDAATQLQLSRSLGQLGTARLRALAERAGVELSSAESKPELLVRELLCSAEQTQRWGPLVDALAAGVPEPRLPSAAALDAARLEPSQATLVGLGLEGLRRLARLAGIASHVDFSSGLRGAATDVLRLSQGSGALAPGLARLQEEVRLSRSPSPTAALAVAAATRLDTAGATDAELELALAPLGNAALQRLAQAAGLTSRLGFVAVETNTAATARGLLLQVPRAELAAALRDAAARPEGVAELAGGPRLEAVDVEAGLEALRSGARLELLAGLGSGALTELALALGMNHVLSSSGNPTVMAHELRQAFTQRLGSSADAVTTARRALEAHL